MSHADSLLSSWWLLPAIWAALSLIASAAFGGLVREESFEEEAASSPVEHAPSFFQFDTPDGTSEVIGRYMGAPIHRSAVFDGAEYEYDRVFVPQCVPGTLDERIVAPGLVYVRRATSGATAAP